MTHIIVGKSTRSRWSEILHGSIVHDLYVAHKRACHRPPAPNPSSRCNALAAVARRLRDPEVLQKLRDAATSGGLYTAVCGHQSG